MNQFGTQLFSFTQLAGTLALAGSRSRASRARGNEGNFWRIMPCYSGVVTNCQKKRKHHNFKTSDFRRV